MLLCRREWVSLYSCNKDIVLAATAGGKTKRRRNGKQRQKERGEGESGGARAAWRDVVTVLVLWTGTGHVAAQQRRQEVNAQPQKHCPHTLHEG